MSINKTDNIFVISNHKIDPCGNNKDEILSYSTSSLSWSFLIPSVNGLLVPGAKVMFTAHGRRCAVQREARDH